MNKWKEGDVYRWKYTGEYNHNSYWCTSQTGVVASNGRMYDTFWGIGINDCGKSFSESDISSKIEVEYVANLSDYEPCNKQDQCYYDDKDLLDLSNSNNRGVYYLRKESVKSFSKMQKIMKRNVKDAEQKLLSATNRLEYEKRQLSELTLDSYVYANEGVSLQDHSYLDEEN